MIKCLLLLGLLCSHLCFSAAPNPLDISAYTNLPSVSRVNLSPNGKSVAFIQNIKGNLMLRVYDINKGQIYSALQSDNKEVTLNWYEWANNDVLLIGAGYTQRQGLIKYSETRLFKFDLNGKKKAESVLPIRSNRQENTPQFQDDVISFLPDEPNHILLAADFDKPNNPSVYKVNINKRKRKRILRPRSHITDWVADRQGNIRFGYGLKETTAFYRLYDKKAEKLISEPLFEFDVFGKEKVTVLGFDKDPNIIYIKALHKDKDALFKVSLNNPSQRELLFYDQHYDFDGTILYSRVSGEVIGFSHSNANDSRVYWDDKYKQFQQAIEKALPDAHNTVVDMSDSGNEYVVLSSSAKTPGQYYLGDRKAKSMTVLAERYPDINEQNYAGKTRYTFKARDGLDIEGYLTTPINTVDSTPLPMIILPHGGPWARDYADFDYWSELFASRGYGVFQPNFRGSYGYGYAFAQAAKGQWGESMQDDLQDAAHFLINEGIADKNRICIAGGSYGGYAAVMAVVKHPETFKCAASFAGVMDLELILSRARFFTNKDVVRKQFSGDDKMLETNSPINHAKTVSRPILLIHGEDDKVVPVVHSRRMFDKLSDAKKDVKYIELESGNHHLSHQAHRHQTLSEFLAFFDTHLK